MSKIQTNGEVGNLIRKLENDYINGDTTISKYVSYDMYDDLAKIDAYDNSKHTTGEKDSKGRRKPFFNIVRSAINIWYRATDIDRRNIKVRATKFSKYIASFVATILLQEWMRKTRFGTFLNKWGRTLAKYGSAVVKFVEKDGELHPIVMDWNKLIVDPVDFYSNPVIEVLELTPAELRKRKGYNQEVVEQLISAHKAVRETLDGQDKDTRDGYIKIYEIHGEMPLSYITEDMNDEDEFVQQMAVLSFVTTENDDKEDYYLAQGKEEKSPYMLTHLIEEDGKTLSTGAVKQLFESQWMVNHTAKSIKDQLDLASKLIFQTADENFVGKNVITAIETGDIMTHSPNMPLTQVANNSHDITSLQNYGEQWRAIGNEQVGASDAMRGIMPKSGTAWRQTEAILQENYSLFEQMTENKGLHLEDMMRDYVIPHIKKKIDTKDEIVAVLEAQNVKKIDKMYAKAVAVKKAKEEMKQALLKGEAPGFIDTEATEQEVMSQMAELGETRYFVPSEMDDKTWKDIVKDLEWELEIDITGEQSNNTENVTTLTTLFQTLMGSGQLEDARLVMSKILEMTGTISPIELQGSQPTPPAPVAPTAPATTP